MYGAVQLQGNIYTHPEHMQGVSRICAEHAQDASVQAQNLSIKLQQDLINCYALFAKHGTCPEHVQDVSGTHVNVTWELSWTISLGV